MTNDYMSFFSMVALQGDAEKLLAEAGEISLRLREKAKERIEGETEEIVTNGYFGEESTGLSKHPQPQPQPQP